MSPYLVLRMSVMELVANDVWLKLHSRLLARFSVT